MTDLVYQNYTTTTSTSFSIPDLTDLSFTVTSWNIPGVTTGSPRQPTMFTDIPLRGDKLVYEPLVVEFIVTEDLANWLSVHDWLVGITAPFKASQFANKRIEYADGTVTIYSSHNNKLKAVSFKNMVPVSLSELQFVTTDTETTYLKATATFMFERFVIITES